MKIKYIYFGIAFFLAVIISCGPDSRETGSGRQSDTTSFSFVFMTDIHIMNELDGAKGFLQAIDTVNKLHPDFVLTGGDLVKDALEQTHERADSLYQLYIQTSSNFQCKVYNTPGNHELFGVYEKDKIDTSNPDYGIRMFERKIGKPYYSFDHKGWHFIILNSIAITPDRNYEGYIDSVQIKWLKSDLEKLKPETPIIVSTHIPFITVSQMVTEKSLATMEPWAIISNGKEVLQLFDKYNLRLVLQGHHHFYEDITYQYNKKNYRFVTGGAVSSAWWNGPRFGLEEGFLKVDINKDDISCSYVDFGWEAKK